MTSRKSERRFYSASRVSSILGLEIQVTEDKVLRARSINISQTGILLNQHIDLDVGECVEICIHLPKNKKVNALAQIARHIGEEPHQKTALQLLEVGQKDQENWLQFISLIEKMHSGNSVPTVAGRLLQQRQSSGINRRKILVQFENKPSLKDFIEDKVRVGKLFINSSLPKTPGDEIELLLIHPDKEKSFRLFSKISESSETLVNQNKARKGLTLMLENIKETELQKFLED